MEKAQRIMFVCMGNICRSPAAEGILKHILQQKGNLTLHVESSGLGDWHVGQSPDSQIQETLKSRGIALLSKAQQFKLDDFDHFDYILAADKEVLYHLLKHAESLQQKEKIHLITDFSKTYRGQSIPDPYLQGGAAFELVVEMIEDSCHGLVEKLQRPLTP